MQQLYPNPEDLVPNFKHVDIPIGGKLVTAKYSLSMSQTLSLDDEAMRKHIRHEICTDLAEYMITQKLVAITMMDDPVSMTKNVYARCYLAPDDQVKILRMKYDGPGS